MLIKIALIVSVIIQFLTAIIALSLVKRTRTNIAWWLISFSFLLMAFRRVFEIMEVYGSGSKLVAGMLSSWTGVLISVIMLVSLLFIKRIFNLQNQLDEIRAHNEKEVLNAIIQTEERERRFFAKELHDGLGPLLSATKMAVSSMNSIKKSDARSKTVENTEKLIDESIKTLKEVSNKLSPHILDNFGLLKALKTFINSLTSNGNPRIHLNSNLGEQRFDYTTEVVFYRIACELISNSMKYADCGNIYIDLNLNDGIISLIFIDDGKGFEYSGNLPGISGMGLANIQSRIRSLGGSFNIFTRPGEGVRVEIEAKTKNHG